MATRYALPGANPATANLASPPEATINGRNVSVKSTPCRDPARTCPPRTDPPGAQARL